MVRLSLRSARRQHRARSRSKLAARFRCARTRRPMDSLSRPPPPSGDDPSEDGAAANELPLPWIAVTQVEQMIVEAKVADIYRILFGAASDTGSVMLELWRDQHVEYLTKGLRNLGPSFHVLDANRPWLCYWMAHGLALLEETLDNDLEDDIVDFLS